MCIKFSLTFKNQRNSQKRGEKYMIISIDKNKAFNKIQLIYDFKSLSFFIGKASPTWNTYIFLIFRVPSMSQRVSYLNLQKLM